MRAGAVVASGVSRRFLVYPQRHVTLKEAIVRRNLRRTEIWALRDVSFEIEPGEAVGVIGRNGSGKTTLLRMIASIFGPTTGQLETGGTVASLLELGAGFHPDFTGRENVYMNGSIHGLKRRYIDERMEEIVSFAELESFIDVPVRTYSAGMYMRLGFSIAAHLDPDVLLLDEVFAVGDEAFQRKCIGKVLDLKERGRTILFVSHSAPAVERLCERALLLKAGMIEARDAGVAPRISVEFRDANGSLLGATDAVASELGWDGAAGRAEVIFTVPRLPLADGRFQLSVALSRPDSTRQFHRLDPALEFTVFPDEDQLGWFRFDGQWSLVRSPSAVEAS